LAISIKRCNLKSNYLVPTIDKKSLGDQVYECLTVKIINGELQGGDWIRQQDIALEFEVSHTPVRQALERLVAEGMAEHIAHKGVRILELSKEEIAEIWALRMFIEPRLVRLAVPNLSKDKEKIEYLSKLVEQANEMKTLSQMNTRRLINLEFHREIVKNAQNVTMVWLYDLIIKKFPDWILAEGFFKFGDRAFNYLEAESAGHRAILAAIVTGNVELVVQKVTEHLNQTIQTEYLELIGISPDLLRAKQRDLEAIGLY
jgi:DNA-binding GntR family transcriptional regulator